MMRSNLCVGLVMSIAAAPALAQNVALNKPVVIVAGAGSLLTPTPPTSVVTNGIFLGETTSYSNTNAVNGALRWNTGLAGSTVIEIQLGALHTIDGIIVQADDNDSLAVSYLDAGGTFQPLYSVPFLSVGFGFRTRPSADQVTWAPLTPVNTTTIRVTNSGGDGFYGLSELQLRGVIVCAADYNGDTEADVLDFLDFMDDFGACDGQPLPCGQFGDIDFNGDTLVDVLDFLDFIDAFGQGC